MADPRQAGRVTATGCERLGSALRLQAGFTLVELLVAATVIVVGMAGALTMLMGANAMTVATRGREAATNVQRELIERIQAMPYARLSQSTVYQDLQAVDGLADALPAAGYQLRRRGFTYTATVSVCSVDDPKDGYGAHAAGVFCPGTAGAVDLDPEDYKVVTVDLEWAQGDGSGHSRQQTLVNSAGSNVGPSICDLTVNGGAETLISSVMSTVTLGVCVSFAPSTVSITVDGEAAGSAGGSGTAWSYPWAIEALVDGSYLVGARAYDAQGRPGPVRSTTVTLNRFVPRPPAGLAAGRNGSVVEAEWLANPERDVVGYQLYRGTTVVASCSFSQPTDCQDTAPPNLPLLTYTVVALDRDPSGDLRAGLPSAPVTVTTLNHRPNPPTGLTATRNANGDAVLRWSPPSPDDPDLGDSIAFYRIYRDGTAVGDRFDRTGLGTEVEWTDARSAGASHTYYVSAVDRQLAESILVGLVSP